MRFNFQNMILAVRFCPNIYVSIKIGLFRSQVIVFAITLLFYFVSSFRPQFVRICMATREIIIVVLFCFVFNIFIDFLV